jgi:glutamate racemase
VLRIYLREALELCSPSVVILGCTHYPLIAPLVSEVLRELGSNAEVVDSAKATASVVSTEYPSQTQPSDPAADATFEFFATDSVEKFERLGSHFLGRPVQGVQLVDLGG